MNLMCSDVLDSANRGELTYRVAVLLTKGDVKVHVADRFEFDAKDSD